MKQNSLGVIFPGQGSQSIGMLNDIAANHPEVKTTFDQASNVLGYDLWTLTQEGPAEELDKTEKTQPAILAASYAQWLILKKSSDLNPALLAGHSLGEYSALVCAGSLSFTDAIMLVAARGKFMQAACPDGEGALAAIVGLEDDIVAEICKSAAFPNEVLSPANFNSPGQVVIAGNIQAVERAIGVAKEKGARLAKKLSVSVPSHCILMQPAAEKLGDMLQKISLQPPKIPFVNNVDVAICKDVDSIREALIKQLFMPVRWVEIIKLFSKSGIKEVIECGPGKVLSGLNKRINPDLQSYSTNDLASLETLLTNKLLSN